MSDGRAPGLLWDALTAAKKIGRYTEGKDLTAYLADDFLRSAVERQFEIIGEALSVLRRKEPLVAARVSRLAEAVGLRNLLIHVYGRIDNTKVWLVVTNDLAQLESELRALLAEQIGTKMVPPTAPPPP